MFQFGGIGALYGGINPQKSPRADGTESTVPRQTNPNIIE